MALYIIHATNITTESTEFTEDAEGARDGVNDAEGTAQQFRGRSYSATH